MRITDEQRRICEDMGWKVNELDNGDVEIVNYSPAGENIIFYVGSDETFADGVKTLAVDYDADEHADMWIGSRGKNGVPNSIRELINDAGAIGEMLQELAIKIAAASDGKERAMTENYVTEG